MTGGALGIAAGYGMTRGLQLLMPPYYLPREALITIDWRVMLFVLAISIATALIFGTAPAFHAGRVDLAGSMRASSRAVTVDRGRRRMRDGLIVVEVALACMLLVGAGLLMRSFIRLQQVEAARDPATLVTATLTVPTARFTNSGAGSGVSAAARRAPERSARRDQGRAHLGPADAGVDRRHAAADSEHEARRGAS